MPLLLGARELRARMDALKETFQPIGRQWAEETARLARTRVPVKTGKTQRSIRVRSATKKTATVVAAWPARVIESDVKAHTIMAKRGSTLKFDAGGRTIFRRKVEKRAQKGRPFLAPSAAQALDDSLLREQLVKAWNDAA